MSSGIWLQRCMPMSKFLDWAVVMFYVAGAVSAASSGDTTLTVFFCGMLMAYELIGIEQKLKVLLDRMNEEAGDERKR